MFKRRDVTFSFRKENCVATCTLHELVVCIPGVRICVFVVASREIKQLVTVTAMIRLKTLPMCIY